jgi:hypothetical protein
MRFQFVILFAIISLALLPISSSVTSYKSKSTNLLHEEIQIHHDFLAAKIFSFTVLNVTMASADCSASRQRKLTANAFPDSTLTERGLLGVSIWLWVVRAVVGIAASREAWEEEFGFMLVEVVRILLSDSMLLLVLVSDSSSSS